MHEMQQAADDFHEVELSVGDSFQVGDQVFTVVDIDGDEVSLRIDEDLTPERLVGSTPHAVARPR